MWLARALLVLLCMPKLGFATSSLTRREKKAQAASTINADGAIEKEQQQLEATKTHQNTDKAMAQLGLEKLTKTNLANFAKMVGGTGLVQLADEHTDKKTLLDAVHQGLRQAFLEEEEEVACEDCSMKTKTSGPWCSSVPDDQESEETCPNFYSPRGGSAGTVCKFGTKKGKTRCLNDRTRRCCAGAEPDDEDPEPPETTCEDCSAKTKTSGAWCSSVPDDQKSEESCPNFYQPSGGSAGTGKVCKFGTKKGKTRCVGDKARSCC